MTTEFNIGDKVWYGYPEPQPGVIDQIIISSNSILYYMQGEKSGWKDVAKTRKEAALKGLKSDLESHERYIAKLKQEIEELEIAMGEA
jgi:hypothetical protein